MVQFFGSNTYVCGKTKHRCTVAAKCHLNWTSIVTCLINKGYDQLYNRNPSIIKQFRNLGQIGSIDGNMDLKFAVKLHYWQCNELQIQKFGKNHCKQFNELSSKIVKNVFDVYA